MCGSNSRKLVIRWMQVIGMKKKPGFEGWPCRGPLRHGCNLPGFFFRFVLSLFVLLLFFFRTFPRPFEATTTPQKETTRSLESTFLFFNHALLTSLAAPSPSL